jgi:integration host factor subunit beta
VGEETVTKKEIVKVISDRSGLTQLKTKEIVQWTFDAIIDTLITEKRIELRNFGVFEVKRREARKARNPRTGERVDVEPKNVVTFQPGKEMEEKVRQMPLVPEKPRKARRLAQAQASAVANPPVSGLPVPSGDGATAASHAATTNGNGHESDGANAAKKKRVKKEI